ncbi:STAS domain-containing protein [Mesobacillus foraminis]|uniref:RsbT co-antagonist protein RsbR n=1 Tax=Mesobacillus foraminis TaxID=279826 RepID=A0A4R2BG63_9BACI|nr:STAS domain-containing protein [Mesobacillus foraminis]TCN26027.1 rsbT co-antagonist protein RsbR [Mesobacillus foraminis]
MEKFINKLFENNSKQIENYWKTEMEEAIKKEKSASAFNEPLTLELFTIIFESIKKVDTQITSDLQFFYSKILEYNGSINFITLGFQSFRRVALKVLIHEELTREEILTIYNYIDRWFDPVISQVVNNCSQTLENTFTEQKQALKELSAPVIELFDQIAVMPLVGNINDDRAKNIKDNLLIGIAKNQASIVFIDISGVPVVDTFVAQNLIDTARATRLLGAECILVGTRPEIAQTIVNLGIDLSEIRTFNSLHKGLLYALEKLNISIN